MGNSKAKKKCALIFDESGTVSVVAAIIFTTLCGFGGLALDLGHYYKVKAELQRTADAGALAGVTGFIPLALPQTPVDGWGCGHQDGHDEHNKAIIYNMPLVTYNVDSGYSLLNQH
jgi:hypothetical protein